MLSAIDTLSIIVLLFILQKQKISTNYALFWGFFAMIAETINQNRGAGRSHRRVGRICIHRNTQIRKSKC